MNQPAPITPDSIKVFKLTGEHAQAWCCAPSMDAAERFFEAQLDPLELSAASIDEVPEDHWQDLGFRPTPSATAATRMLALDRGDFH